MHFPIIAIESIGTKKEDFMTDLPYDDATLQYHTDYYGDMYNEEERKQVINSDWFKDILNECATIDLEEETITFLDADTIRKNFSEYLVRITEELHEKAEKGELKSYELSCASEEYKGHDTLFYFIHGRTSFDFVEDSAYYAGETYKIGNIFDAHI